MDENKAILLQYYQKSLECSHSPKTEFAAKINECDVKIAIDCGCGTGSDISYLSQLGYQVYGFDVNPDSVSICRKRFSSDALVEISEDSFESYDYPVCGLVIANSSLFFAEPAFFQHTWLCITQSLSLGGAFAGDFMGVNDSWASGLRCPTNPLSKQQIIDLFEGFEIVRFNERDELGKTSLGKTKHWHTFSVVAVKRISQQIKASYF